MWTCGNLTAYIAGSTLVAMEDPGMAGPGIYRPDPSEGMTRPEDVPPPQILYSCRDAKHYPCPRCGHQAYRDKRQQRTLHDLGDLDTWGPRDLVITYSQHYCVNFSALWSGILGALWHHTPPGQPLENVRVSERY